MNEESLPSFGSAVLRFIPGAIRRVLSRLSRRRRPRAPDPELRARAASAIREYAHAHAALFERAERLREKADRLERAGTPSESASNRAERARREVEAGLAALRSSFMASARGHEERRAFDREVEIRYPAFKLSDGAS